MNFFDRLLPPAWEIYIQPHLNGLRPDFVLLHPNVGIAVFEVKDWNLDAMNYWVEITEGRSPILMAEKHGVEFSRQQENPIEKVYRYKSEIFNLYCPRLKQKMGFAAITAGVIFPYESDARVKALLAPFLSYRGMASLPAYNPVSGMEAVARGDLGAVFPEALRSSSRLMNPDLAKDLRNWLVEPDFAANQRRSIALDANQLSFVKSRTVSGYRRIRGPAGSGKSLILAARAAELLGEGKQILVVTFNITLLHYLMDVAVRWPTAMGKTRSDITWLNFHQWCKRMCEQHGFEKAYADLWDAYSLNEVLTEKLPALVGLIIERKNIAPEYDAVLVDEGQDFCPSWWDVLRKVCKPGGEMLLVADVTQDIYGTASAWTDEAMKGAGFSGKWAELDISYRLPALALEKAAEFAENYLPDTARILPRNAQNDLALEQCDLRWVQLHSLSDAAASVCCDELLRMFSSDGHQHYAFADATFLCDSRTIGGEVVERLNDKGIHCVHTYDPDDQESRRQKVGFYMGDARVKATTLHSFKGWEARCLVIYIGPHITPQALALMYTGLTRIKRHSDGSALTVICNCEKLRDYGARWPDFVAVC